MGALTTILTLVIQITIFAGIGLVVVGFWGVEGECVGGCLGWRGLVWSGRCASKCVEVYRVGHLG